MLVLDVTGTAGLRPASLNSCLVRFVGLSEGTGVFSPNGTCCVGRLDRGSTDDKKIQTKKGGLSAVAVPLPHGWAGAMLFSRMVDCGARGV
jgi:hypothetical protein